MTCGLYFLGLGIFCAIMALVYWKRRKKTLQLNKDDMANRLTQPATCVDTKENVEGPVTDSDDTLEDPFKNSRTRQVVIQVLEKIGGVYQIPEGENRIRYKYQGHTFFIDAEDQFIFINVWDPYWHQIPLEDVDQLAIMRKVINQANLHEECQLFYTIDNETGRVWINSKRNIIFVEQIPQLDIYLCTIFETFFEIERHFLLELERARNEYRS